MWDLQNEINCMNDSKDFQDAESIRNGNSHVASRQVSFPLHPIPGGMSSGSVEMSNRKKKGRQAFRTRMVSRETFLQIQMRPFQHLIRRNWTHGLPGSKSRFIHQQWKRVRGKHKIMIRDTSLDSQPQWRRLFKLLWGRPTTIADFRPSFRQIPYPSHVCLLEDEIQNWDMYLFTISYGSCAMDQRSGDGWFSGLFFALVINKRNSNAEFWSTRCEDCFSTEQNHP